MAFSGKAITPPPANTANGAPTADRVGTTYQAITPLRGRKGPRGKKTSLKRRG